MLRLTPTGITLDSSDVAWHVRRRERHLETLKETKPSKAAVNKPETPPQSPSPGREHAVADELPARSSTVQGSPEEIPIYSDEPVPRESQAFWDTILADAGTSVSVHQESLARSPQLVVPSDAFLENIGSVRLSVRGNEDEPDQVRNAARPQELLISPRSPISDASDPSTEIQSRLSPLSLPSLDDDENHEQRQPGQSSYEQPDPYPLTNEDVDMDLAPDNHPFRSRQKSESGWANPLDVDGPSDAVPAPHHHRSTSSLQDPEPGSVGMPFGAQARKAELAASRDVPGSYGTQHLRSRSGGLQRSRLYISEAAASSSPDKRQEPPDNLSDEAPVDDVEILSVPPRRRKGYKRRSETYSHVASEASTTHVENSPAVLARSNPFDRFRYVPPPAEAVNPTSSPRYIQQHHHPTSSPYHRPSTSTSSHSSPTYPHGMSPHNRSNSLIDLPSLLAASFDETPNPLRRPFEPVPLPSIAGSRNPSTAAAFPPNHPTADENGRYPGSPYLPSTPPRSISSTSITNATPTRISIYNDSLPAASQPQTPVGLPRNGLPPMALQNPFYTAPARTA
ncbi:MAG: hypothetical protein L6R39_001712, partial [Caloplaca ligustica]